MHTWKVQIDVGGYNRKGPKIGSKLTQDTQIEEDTQQGGGGGWRRAIKIK